MKGLRAKVGMILVASALAVPTMAAAAEDAVTTTDTVVSTETSVPAVQNLSIKFRLDSSQYEVNGTMKTMDTAPDIVNQTSYVSLKHFAEAIGAELTWDASGENATLKTSDFTVTFKIGDSLIWLNGAEVELGAYIGEKDGRTIVPIRALGQLFGWSVNFYGDGNIYLSKVVM
ncbi:copper amine oxidase N-terminal domain-containing protein [Paenibacillus aurantiacus]|uniref:Copper amine oxidase N-terminal domain-containing protein n=1 Tax=Paenibacillus aurantiacus TaxID=1936118 RepID=A0ABV5L0X4_9BACL